jgi:hypothetical protein
MEKEDSTRNEREINKDKNKNTVEHDSSRVEQVEERIIGSKTK